MDREFLKQLCLEDICKFCELGWYEWLKFCSHPFSFPEDALICKNYCGLSIEIGSTMTAKILTPTGEIVHHSTYRPLFSIEITDTVDQNCKKTFLCTAAEQWGTYLTRRHLTQVVLENTPEIETYFDEEQL